MRILISGGAGFIGSHLVDKLMENEKNEVCMLNKIEMLLCFVKFDHFFNVWFYTPGDCC